MNLSTKQKQVHRHRKQTNGYQRKEEGVRDQQIQTIKRKINRNFPGGSDNKESGCDAEDPGLIPRRRSPGEGNGNPLQYSCLEFHGQRSLGSHSSCVTKSPIPLNDNTLHFQHEINNKDLLYST